MASSEPPSLSGPEQNLVDSLHKVLQERRVLETLTSEILATLRIPKNRETLPKAWQDQTDIWWKQYQRVRNGGA